MSDIDINTLKGVLAGAESMVKYYDGVESKIRQNEVLEAAGLSPIHNANSLAWDRDQLAQKRREVECLKAVVALLEGAQVSEAA